MKIDIVIHQSSCDNRISRTLARRARLTLSRFAAAIQAITIRITDTNGPKGGEDKKCVVSVKLTSIGEIVVQGEGENIFGALNRCLSRVGRAVRRNLERRRDTPIRKIRRQNRVVDKPLLLDGKRFELQD